MLDLSLSKRVLRLLERAQELKDTRLPQERPLFVTEAYSRTEGLHIALRQARALRHLLANESIGIPQGDLIAGLQNRFVKVHPGLSDHLNWVGRITFPEWRGINLEGAPPEIARELMDAARYWRRHKPAGADFWRFLPEEARRAQRFGVITTSGFTLGHVIPDFRLALELGMEGITELAEKALRKLRGDDPDHDDKRSFLEAVIEACEAAVEFAHRHATFARGKASETDDPVRRSELLEIAEICDRVPAKPARTFHEAVQCIWFVHDVQEQEMGGPGPTANSFGRIDQYLWPYLADDLRTDRITPERAYELLGCLWVKLNRVYDDQHTMVGGRGEEGDDATNPLSYMLLSLTKQMHIPRAVGVRVHEGSPEDLVRLAAEVAATGLGVPSFFNDSVFVKALTERGIPHEAALDYAVVGCVEIMVPGRSAGRTMGHGINLAKCLELALNDGRCMITGEQLGPRTGDPTEFETFDDVLDAFRTQLSHFTELALKVNVEAEHYQPRHIRFPFLSALTWDCIERGRDITDGGARYDFTGVNLSNLADAVDGLAAIERLVFRDRAVRMSDMVEALRLNFDGRESLRQMMLNRAPRYGCDELEADLIASEIVRHYVSILKRHKTLHGGEFMPLLFGTSPLMVYGFGPKTAALPNGRFAGEPLAMSACPSTLRRSKGSTAELLSVARLPHHLLSGGISYILELPAGMRGEHISEHISHLLRTFFKLGGGSIAFNVLDEGTLRDAQRHPDRYRWLTVRLFGYSHRFVELSSEMQEYVIARCKLI
jgi:formate C-acetyltransferase